MTVTLWHPRHAAAALLLLLPAVAHADTVELRLHQFLPLQSAIPAQVLTPWIEHIHHDSNGKLLIRHFPSMQLGGTPADLIDQVTDGVVDLIWTLPGYTPGRFPKSEAFELPFMGTTATATSKAFHEYVEHHMADELPNIRILAAHTHGPGVLHSRTPIRLLNDLKGLKVRGPTRTITTMLGQLGAAPIGMPVPAVPEALARGVIDATVIPWEVSIPLKIAELVPYHSEFTGKHGLYTATFFFAMNQRSYNRLPPNLQAVINQNSGIALAAKAGRVMDQEDVAGRKTAAQHGNTITVLDAAETHLWRQAAQPVISNWIARMNRKGHNGAALVETARTLIARHEP